MDRQNRKFTWQTALGALAISWGILGAIEVPASAAPRKAPSRIAQVGVRSQISSPTPLNLRPRTHIPLPTNSRSRDYYGYPRSRGYYGHGKYRHYRDRHYPPRPSRGGTVIIINPSNYSEYSNYNYSEYGGRIRIIRK